MDDPGLSLYHRALMKRLKVFAALGFYPRHLGFKAAEGDAAAMVKATEDDVSFEQLLPVHAFNRLDHTARYKVKR